MKDDKKQASNGQNEEQLHKKVADLLGPPPEEREATGSTPPANPKPKEEAPQPAKAEQPKPQEGEGFLADNDLDKAVDEIAHQESDDLLKEEDEAVQKAWAANEDKRSFKQKIKDWWHNPRNRKATITISAFIVLILAVVPNTRYFLLNLVGVRSSASITVLDQGTGLPLKNVDVSINNQFGTTDDDGYVRLERVRLGKTQLKVERRAFAVLEKPITIGWGSNPLGEQSLEPVGLQYSFKTVDFLSGKPIEKAEAYSGEASAFSNAEGEIILTLDTTSDENVEITIRAEGYRDEKVSGTAGQEQQEIKMAPAVKHAFVSKRSGKFDVYKIDADGQNEELILAGTGNERDDVVLAAHPERNVAVLVSTREGVRNSDGYLLSTLTLIDLETNKTTSLGRSERYQIVGWSGDRLVYVQIASGASASNPKRHRLLSYDYQTGETTEIATSNYFNDVMLAQNKIYYAPSSAYQNGVNVSLFTVDPDGENRQVIIEDETWNLFRSDYDTLTIAVGQVWYEYKIGGEESPSALNGAPAEPKSRLYVDGPDGVSSLWVDKRDGKGVLINYNKENQEDGVVASESGLGYPVRWLNSTTAIYRISTEDETADYVVNVAEGKTQKLVDVTDTAGIESWYYY